MLLLWEDQFFSILILLLFIVLRTDPWDIHGQVNFASGIIGLPFGAWHLTIEHGQLLQNLCLFGFKLIGLLFLLGYFFPY